MMLSYRCIDSDKSVEVHTCIPHPIHSVSCTILNRRSRSISFNPLESVEIIIKIIEICNKLSILIIG